MSTNGMTSDDEPSCSGIGSSAAPGFASPAVDVLPLPTGLPPLAIARQAKRSRSIHLSLGALVDLPGRTLDLVAAWIERSERRARMMEFDDHLLRDLGTDRFRVEREWRKPFWRA